MSGGRVLYFEGLPPPSQVGTSKPGPFSTPSSLHFDFYRAEGSAAAKGITTTTVLKIEAKNLGLLHLFAPSV